MTSNYAFLIELGKFIAAIGGFKIVESVWKYFRNRKKDKLSDASDFMEKYSKLLNTYMEQSDKMEATITELRKNDLEKDERINLMDKKLDERNQLVMSLSADIKGHTKKIDELLKKVKVLDNINKILDNMKCERLDCTNRIPAKKTIQIKNKRNESI